jgi:hypothetical protein
MRVEWACMSMAVQKGRPPWNAEHSSGMLLAVAGRCCRPSASRARDIIARSGLCSERRSIELDAVIAIW